MGDKVLKFFTAAKVEIVKIDENSVIATSGLIDNENAIIGEPDGILLD